MPDVALTNPQIIYSWKAPLRAYKKRSVGVLRFYIALALLLSLITFFFGERILILPIWAVMFLFYILTTTPPQQVTHQITRFGIETVGNTFRWDFLSHFYFLKRFDYHVLVIVSIAPFFYHLYLVVPEEKIKVDVMRILSDHLVYQERPKKTFTDRLVEWLGKLMPDSYHGQGEEKKAAPETNPVLSP